jgi:hypothetical protein
MKRPLAAAASLLLLGPAAAGAASITGVCPDGSIFIVQDRSRIPCSAAKEVAPEDVPPLRPEYLPRPYTWQVYRENANPNNPYNLIDAARRVRALRGDAAAAGTDVAGAPPAPAFAGAGPEGVATTELPSAAGFAPAPRAPLDLALSSDDVRDLFLIVELQQQSAPGRFLKEDARGEVALEVSLAWSAAFEARLREKLPEARGPVLLFSVLAHRADAFHPNFTFVQGHESFRPYLEEPAQMGLLEGRPGELPAEGVVLGYVVLPEQMDLAEKLDVYWNDRRIETLLQP